MSHTAVKAAWQATLLKVRQSSDDYHKRLKWRCHAAMGPERALMMRDMLKDQGKTLKGEIHALIKAARANPHRVQPERMRELKAAYLWTLQIAKRDREFFNRRYAA